MTPIDKVSVKRYHREIIAMTGGSDGVRDEDLLDAALSAAFQTFGGEDLYPSITAKISRVTYGIISNHPFVDGNKRIGMHMMMVLLDLCRINTGFTNEDIVEIGLALANGEMDDKQLDALIQERAF